MGHGAADHRAVRLVKTVRLTKADGLAKAGEANPCHTRAERKTEGEAGPGADKAIRLEERIPVTQELNARQNSLPIDAGTLRRSAVWKLAQRIEQRRRSWRVELPRWKS